MYYIGQKLRMKDDYMGHGKGKIVTVVEIKDEKPCVVETDGSWGRRRKSILKDYKPVSGDLYWEVEGYKGGYEEVEEVEEVIGDKKPFPAGTRMENLDRTRKFIVVEDSYYFKAGDVLVWERDTDREPYMKRISDGIWGYIRTSRLAYYDEPKLNGLRQSYIIVDDYIDSTKEDIEKAYKVYIDNTLVNKPLSTNSIIMSITTKLRELTRKEPQKTYVKLGITDSNGDLVDEKAYVNYLFQKNEQSKDSEFYKAVKPLLEE